MDPMTHPLPDSVETVQPFGISPAPRTGTARMIGFITAAVGLVAVIWIPFGLLSIAHGLWLGPGDSHFEPVLLGALLGFEMLVACLGCTAGIAAGAGKIWSRFGIILYAILALALALIDIIPFSHYVDSGVGMHHTMLVLVVIKQWVIETPLALAILFTFTRRPIERAYAHPVIQTPDRSNR